MKRTQIIIETNYEGEEQLLNSFYFRDYLEPAIAADACISFLIEEVEVW